MQDLRIDHNLNPYWTHTSFDGLVATVQAGLRHNDGFGIGAKAKASALSGRATAEFNIFGWQVELECVSELNRLKEIE